MLELAAPEGWTAPAVDGISIASTLLGAYQPDRDFLYREFTGYGGQQAVWLGLWKGIRQQMLNDSNQHPLRTQLYRLDGDVSETRDLANEYHRVVAQIEAIMSAEHERSSRFPFSTLD